MSAEPSGSKRRRYSREPDLEVLVEDEVFHVHSMTLMSASDVFAKMLESNMRETLDGRITLEGKSKKEFRLLLAHIGPAYGAAPPDMAVADVPVLVRWADEYQIHGLTARCDENLCSGVAWYERHLLELRRKHPWIGDSVSIPDAVAEVLAERLELASKYKFAKTTESLSRELAQDVKKYSGILKQFSDNPTVMSIVLPAMYRAAKLDVPEDLQTDSLDLWPFVIKAIQGTSGKRSSASSV